MSANNVVEFPPTAVEGARLAPGQTVWDPAVPALKAPFTDDLWPLPLNWTMALGSLVVFWLGVVCGALWILATVPGTALKLF